MRTLKSALLASALMLSTPASAQSDGSLEDTYALQCPNHENNQVCNLLRREMEESDASATLQGSKARTAVKSTIPVSLEDLNTLGDDALLAKSGASEMELSSLAREGDPVAMALYATMKRGLREASQFGRAAGDAGVPRGYLALGRSLLSGWGRDEKAAVEALLKAGDMGVLPAYEVLLEAEEKVQVRLTDAQILPVARKLAAAGRWRGQRHLALLHERGAAVPKDIRQAIDLLILASASGADEPAQQLARIVGQYESTADDQRVAVAAISASAAKGNATSQASLDQLQSRIRLEGDNKAAFAATWGVLPKLAGAMWTDGSDVWDIRWNSDGQLFMERYQANGGWDTRRIFKFYAGRVWVRDSGSAGAVVPVLPSGGVFDDISDAAVIPVSADSFMWMAGRMSSGGFTPNHRRVARTFRRMTEVEGLAFQKQIASYQQANASQGDSGLLGALAMATGAALAGGNAEHVMGAAMKGAELSTDNEMTRNVLAGEGDQMIAAGTQRMHEESARRSASSSSGAHDAGSASRAPSVPPVPLPGALGNSAGGGSGPPIRFYYVVSLVPTANDTRNPLCVSNVVTLDARLDADPWGRRAKAAPLVETYRERFVAECSRLGRITSLGNLYYTIEGVDSGWPYPSFHPSDRKVMLP